MFINSIAYLATNKLAFTHDFSRVKQLVLYVHYHLIHIDIMSLKNHLHVCFLPYSPIVVAAVCHLLALGAGINVQKDSHRVRWYYGKVVIHEH